MVPFLDENRILHHLIKQKRTTSEDRSMKERVTFKWQLRNISMHSHLIHPLLMRLILKRLVKTRSEISKMQ